jgi:hypothetical protein
MANQYGTNILPSGMTTIKRGIDRNQLKSMFLDDIVRELRRRNIQIIRGQGGLTRGRVAFLPPPVLDDGEGTEATERNVPVLHGGQRYVDLSSKRQVQHDMDAKGTPSHISRISSGSFTHRELELAIDRVQGGAEQKHVVQETEESPASESPRV